MSTSFWIQSKTFFRSQVAAFVAGAVDWGVTIGAVELLHFYYPVGVGTGAFLGAVTNFYVNRHWSFEVGHHPIGRQAYRYGVVSIGSLFLNTYGVFFITEHFGPNYLFSKLMVSLFISLFYNYPLHRYFVYGGKSHVEHQSNPA